MDLDEHHTEGQRLDLDSLYLLESVYLTRYSVVVRIPLIGLIDSDLVLHNHMSHSHASSRSLEAAFSADVVYCLDPALLTPSN